MIEQETHYLKNVTIINNIFCDCKIIIINDYNKFVNCSMIIFNVIWNAINLYLLFFNILKVVESCVHLLQIKIAKKYINIIFWYFIICELFRKQIIDNIHKKKIIYKLILTLMNVTFRSWNILSEQSDFYILIVFFYNQKWRCKL